MGSIFGPLRPSDERAGLIWGSKISQNPQPPGRPKKLFERVLGRGKRRGWGSSCSGQVQALWKIVLRGGHSLGSKTCWDKGSMCESLISSLQPSSGRLEFGETRAGYPGFR